VLAQVPGQCSILLENTAGQGTTIGHTFEQLRRIMDLMFELKEKNINNMQSGGKSTASSEINKCIPERIGVCLDT